MGVEAGSSHHSRRYGPDTDLAVDHMGRAAMITTIGLVLVAVGWCWHKTNERLLMVGTFPTLLIATGAVLLFVSLCMITWRYLP